MADEKIPFPDAGEIKPEVKADEAPVPKAKKADKADAAPANTPDSPLKAPAAEPPTEDEISAVVNAAPHNEAAAAAVEAGMDVKTANEMTQVGSNI